MLNPAQLKNEIIIPTLDYMGLNSPAAVNLLLGTAVAESRLHFLKQIGGPALGIYQIEPATHADLWDNYLTFRDEMRAKMCAIGNSVQIQKYPNFNATLYNLAYATACARLIYYRRPEPLPDADNWRGLGEYWKRHYNTHLGKGTIAHFVNGMHKLIDNGEI